MVLLKKNGALVLSVLTNSPKRFMRNLIQNYLLLDQIYYRTNTRDQILNSSTRQPISARYEEFLRQKKGVTFLGKQISSQHGLRQHFIGRTIETRQD